MLCDFPRLYTSCGQTSRLRLACPPPPSGRGQGVFQVVDHRRIEALSAESLLEQGVEPVELFGRKVGEESAGPCHRAGEALSLASFQACARRRTIAATAGSGTPTGQAAAASARSAEAGPSKSAAVAGRRWGGRREAVARSGT